ncbi:MAG: MBL fold metallo-hydrolase [Bacteroidota bacterium]
MTKSLRVEFLGTGTSQGVPVIGCDCEVCLSNDPRDQRLRVSILISQAGRNLVVDAGPDFRQQMLRAKVENIDAVLLTHEHNDHIIGLDDVRPFNFRHKKNIPVYGTPPVLQELQQRFAYVFDHNPYPGAPQLDLHAIGKEHSFRVGDFQVQPVEVLHGQLPVLGFRFGDFCYITDAKTISEEERRKLQHLDTLVLNALHHDEHHSHLNISEALALIKDINPLRTYLTHISHRMGRYAEVQAQLPDNVWLAYDGLQIDV